MIRLKAYAKINLGLRLSRKRQDGYHDLATIFHRVDLFDELTIQSSPSIGLRCDDPALPTDSSNLCTKAATLLQGRYGVTSGADMTLVKKIPVGAGLGGGSSDAAAALSGLAQLWGLKIGELELIELALQLGSDVPYFLKNGTAYARGRGEILEYFDLEIPYWILLLYPDIHVSTTWAYGAFDSTGPHHPPGPAYTADGKEEISLKNFILNNIHNPHELNQNLLNDFEPIVLHEHKKIGVAKLMLYSEGACFAQMSGSGSSVFGFFHSEDKARSAAKKLGNRYRVFLTPPGFRPG